MAHSEQSMLLLPRLLLISLLFLSVFSSSSSLNDSHEPENELTRQTAARNNRIRSEDHEVSLRHLEEQRQSVTVRQNSHDRTQRIDNRAGEDGNIFMRWVWDLFGIRHNRGERENRMISGAGAQASPQHSMYALLIAAVVLLIC